MRRSTQFCACFFWEAGGHNCLTLGKESFSEPRVAESVWPSEELWSFQPNPSLRLVRLEGAESVDPQQTNIPDAWKPWKAYHLTI